MEINPIKPTDGLIPAMGQVAAGQEQSQVSFKELLSDALAQVNGLQRTADTSVTRLAAGDGIAIDEVMLAVQKADLALQLTQQIRNKLVDAYQEVSRMQI
jgi:flagellar hook-basal body complex protein FliE